MKQKVTIAMLLSVFLLIGCGETQQTPVADAPPDDPELRLTHESASPLRGYKSINMLVRERLVDDPEFQLVRYLQDYDPIRDFQGGSILPLLGGYLGRGATMSNQSAIPGAMNMLLWFVVIDGLASDIAKQCSDGEQAIALRTHFKESVLSICQIQDGPEHARAELEKVWNIAVKQDATVLQKELWLTFLAEISGQEDRASYVRDAILTALYSPEFLAGR